tara:strand:+ start:231 stop:1145 length:915 start_codon:yes stop_codon:yes gene_type:complete
MSILRADSIRDRAGTGAPDFPNGLTGTLTGNVTGTATTATALSGTPNISVGTLGCGNVTSTGDVTGVNATFSGNLTVQGTTTTIDTAVTSVDSLAVDGNITGLGNLGVGTASPSQLLHLSKSAASQILLERTGSNPSQIAIKNEGELLEISQNTDGIIFKTGSSPTERLRITSTGTAIFKAGLAEKFNNVGSTMASGTHAIQSGNIIRFTGNENGNNSLNITGIHSTLANGEALSFTVIISPNGSGIINAINIDGVAPATAIQWSGGSVPSAGASGRDVYTFTVLKIGTATNAYEIYGAATNYA